MKKLFYFILILTCVIYAGDSWRVINPKVYGGINKIHCFSETKVIMAGGNGLLIMTEDGGKTWNNVNVNIPILPDYTDMVFINDDIGWISCEGLILKTVDGGHNWDAIYSGEGHISAIHFASIDTGYFALFFSGKLFKTFDGGETWNELYDFEHRLEDIKFIDTNNGWALNSGMIHKTQDGGNHWSTIYSQYNHSTDPLDMKFIYSIEITDKKTGFLSGTNDERRGIIAKTENGGRSWSVVCTTESPFGSSFGSIDFLNERIGWAVNGNTGGALYKTLDGGDTWSETDIGCRTYEFFTDSIGWFSNINETVMLGKTKDGCKTYVDITPQPFTDKNLNDIFFTEDNIGFIAGELGTLYKSEDGGLSWESLATPTTESLNSLYFLDKNKGVIVGNEGTILRTVDSGNNWELISSGETYDFSKVIFTDIEHGYIISDNMVLESFNTGVSWDTLFPFDSISVSNIQFVDEENGFITSNREIFKTTDAGVTWTMINLDTLSSARCGIASTYFLNENTGWLSSKSWFNSSNGSGDEGQMYITVDAGYSWNLVDNGGKTRLYFLTENLGWSNNSGNDYIEEPAIIMTEDGGDNWQNFAGFWANEFFEDQNSNLWVVGDEGLILTTAFSPATRIEQPPEKKIIATELILFQNYPNPFNPSTTIEFKLPKSEFITLKVYNILGKEVANLVSAKLRQGNHRYTFNGRHLASGVYYYQLVAGEFKEVRKMILLR